MEVPGQHLIEAAAPWPRQRSAGPLHLSAPSQTPAGTQSAAQSADAFQLDDQRANAAVSIHTQIEQLLSLSTQTFLLHFEEQRQEDGQTALTV